MSVVAGAPGELADLASALTAASTSTDAVVEMAAKAAASLIGDAGGVRLARQDGRYDPILIHHADAELARRLATMLTRPEDRVDEGFSATMRATRRPVVLPAPSDDQLRHLAAPDRGADEIRAALLAPLVSGQTYLGYLAFVRITPGRTYAEADVALAHDVAAMTATALATARSVDQLRASEERYRRIVETTLEGVWQLDSDGVTTFVNEPMAQLLGMEPEQVVGLSMRGFLNDQGQVDLPRRLVAWREGRAEHYETRLVRADGSTRWVHVSSAPLPGDFDHTPGTLCLVTDITEQVYARGQKRQLDYLRRLDSLGQLVGGISHDFKNLFTVIAGSAEIIAAETEPNSTLSEFAAKIVKAAASGRTLTHQLLAFGRGGGARAEAIVVPDLLTDMQHLLGRTLGEQIKLTIVAEPDVWPIRADRGQLEQVLVNLAVNARDAMPRGGVLSLEAANTVIDPGELDDPDLAGRFVRLAVADTGAGMDPETRAHAFEPFFTTKPTAAGLGLATVENIVRSSGGHIRLYSEPRIGTTIKVFLPAPASTAPEITPAASDGAPRRGHILAVEDQPELAHLIRYLLQPAGYTVTVATDPHDAITRIASGDPPDLLLTDVIMPGMTGPELGKALCAAHPALRVLYMSGYSAAVLGTQGHLDDDSVLIQKPFNRDTLLAAVERALRG
jgi:PAS domain S-box-containing protein